MNTEVHATSPFENDDRNTEQAHQGSPGGTQGGGPRESRLRAWAGRLWGAAASVAIAAVIAVGGAGVLTTQEAASAGVSQHNYAILTSTSQGQSTTSTPQKDKEPDES